MCMGREIRQDTHVIVEMIFSLGGYHSSPRDAHAHKIDHIFARSAPRVPHRTAPNEMPKLLCMQNSRLFPQTHDTQHGAVQHVPFQSNATYALDKFLTIISTSISICGWHTNIQYRVWKIPNIHGRILSIGNWVLYKRSLDGENSFLKFIIKFRKNKIILFLISFYSGRIFFFSYFTWVGHCCLSKHTKQWKEIMKSSIIIPKLYSNLYQAPNGSLYESWWILLLESIHVIHMQCFSSTR